MKIDEEIISERKRIMGGFNVPLQYTPLFATDRSDHKCQLEKAYKEMLHEVSAIDDCSRRFEAMFKEQQFYKLIQVRREN